MMTGEQLRALDAWATSAGIDGDLPRATPGVCHIFLSAAYSRRSGSDLTAITPSAAPAAAMVIAVTYPSARISFLLLFSRSATRGFDVVVPRPVARLRRWPPRRLLPACGGPSYLTAVLDDGAR
jgi:hypothetical protein